ncbi:EF-hand domain-containing protein [Streptomyces sp. NPDC096033]|uniref:EF-hand domain-containing protein n=1 Tax=Streptomyces sp. NPDC096033 TaxID=3366071 RepID=UPI003808E5A7
MTHEVISRKYDRTFDMLDADGDQVLQEKDFIALAESIARTAGLEPGSAKARTLLAEWRRCWTVLLEHADADGDGQISRTEFHQAMAGAYGDTTLLERNLRAGFEAEFAAIDSDDDGVATLQELEAFLRAWGMDADQAHAAVTRLDLDGNGRITRDEYLSAWTSFLLSEDSQDAGSTLFGPLT